MKPPETRRRGLGRLLIGLTLSVLCLYLALHGSSLQAMLDAISVAKWPWVLLTAATFVLTQFLKAFRWHLFFPARQIRLSKAISVYFIGQMLNAVLPARAGDVGRIYLIGEDPQVSRGTAFSTIILEKIVDLVMLSLAFLVVAVWLTLAPYGVPQWLTDWGRVLIPVTGLGLTALLAFTVLGRKVWLIFRRILTPFPSGWQAYLDSFSDQALTALEQFRNGRTMLPLWGWSVVIWGLMVLTVALLFPAFHLDVPPLTALLLTVVLISGVAVPPLPGNLGVFAYLCQLVLGLFGVGRETALVFGITLQAVVFLPQIAMGLICLIWTNRFQKGPRVGGSS